MEESGGGTPKPHRITDSLFHQKVVDWDGELGGHKHVNDEKPHERLQTRIVAAKITVEICVCVVVPRGAIFSRTTTSEREIDEIDGLPFGATDVFGLTCWNGFPRNGRQPRKQISGGVGVLLSSLGFPVRKQGHMFSKGTWITFSLTNTQSSNRLCVVLLFSVSNAWLDSVETCKSHHPVHQQLC